MAAISGWTPRNKKNQQYSEDGNPSNRRILIHENEEDDYDYVQEKYSRENREESRAEHNAEDREHREYRNNQRSKVNTGIIPEVLLGNDLSKGRPRVGDDARTTFYSPDGSCFTMNMEQYSTHLLLLGGIGCGKTNVFNHIIQSLRSRMTTLDVMFILDSKGDFYREFYKPGDVVIGNGKRYRRQSSVWNIYGEVMGRMPRPGERYEYKKEWDLNAREIMKALFKNRRSSTQPFFADAAADLISMKIISVLRSGNLEEMHTYKLKEFFKSAQVKDYDALTCDPSNRDFAGGKQYYGDGTTPQALAVFAYINSLVSECFVGVFGDEKPYSGDRYRTERYGMHDGGEFAGEFAMRDLVREKNKRVIFVEYDLSVGEVLGPIYQLLYDQALKEALGRNDMECEEAQGNVFMICDELKLLGAVSHQDDGLNFGRSLGVKIVAGLQSVNQIYDIYGEAKGKVILSGFSNMFCFRTGDAETRKFISEHFGCNYTDIKLWNEGFEPRHIPRDSNVVEQWDVQNLSRGEAIIDLWDKEPQQPFKFCFSRFDSENES